MDILLGTEISLPFELVRVAIALAGTLAGTYYDLFNNRNVPNVFSYGFLALAFIVNLLAFDQTATLYGIGVAFVIFTATYLLYRAGQLGGADVFLLAAIALLVPVQPTSLMLLPPSMAPSIPFILSVIIASGLSFMAYMLVRSFPTAMKAMAAKGSITTPQWAAAAAIVIGYGVMAILASQMQIMTPTYFAFMTVVILLSLYFTIFKKAINESMVELVSPNHVDEEDIIAIDMMDAALVKKHGITRLADAACLMRLKHFKGKLPVYKGLPPYLPHVLVGLVASILLGNIVLLIAGSPSAMLY